MMKKKSIYIIMGLVAVLIAALAWHNRPMSEERLKKTAVTVKMTTWKEVVAGGKVIEKLDSSEIYAGGQWIDQYYLVPSCFGVARTFFTGKETPRWRNVDDAALLGAYFDDSTMTAERYKKKIAELDYYLRVHDATDEGYNQIAAYQKHAVNILKRLEGVIARRKTSGKLSVRENRSYTIYYIDDDGKKQVLPCVAKETGAAGIATRIQTANRRMPFFAKAVPAVWMNKFNKFAGKLLVKAIGNIRQQRDSDGIYVGELDKKGVRNGYGAYNEFNGDYFEGFWKDGIRTGWGFSSKMDRFRSGEWKEDVYKGERLEYTNARIYGIDISRFQHKSYFVKEKKRVRIRNRWHTRWVKKEMHYPIDWDNMRITSLGTMTKKRISGKVGYKVSFVYIKSTEGTTILNKFYAQDYRDAHAHGIHTGTYHFLSTRTTGSAQAAYFMAHSHYQKGDFPPVLDVEPYPSQIKAMGGEKVLFANIRAWLKAVERAWHVKPVLYLSQSFVNRYLPEAPDLQRDYEVWIARYGEYKPDVHLIYWQLCPDGRVAGIRGAVDINVFNGYHGEFQKFVARYK